MIRDNKGQAGLIRAAEFVDHTPEPLMMLAKGNETLCLTDRHLEAFGRPIHASLSCYNLPAASMTDTQKIAITLGHGEALAADVNILGERAGSLPDLACHILKIAKLVPAALLTRLNISDHDQQVLLAENYQIPIVDFHEIDSLKQDLPIEMMISVSANLPLAQAEDARIIMFKQKNER